MKRATISQTKNNLSALLERVKRGESVLICDRDKPVARLVPIGPEGATEGEQLGTLERLGIVRRAQMPPRKLPPPIELPKGVSLLDALRRDRDDARY